MSFFSSKWVERPAHVEELGPTALPDGYSAGGVSAGIKPEGLDVGLLFSEREETTSAAMFTASALQGAPVTVSRTANLAGLRGVAVNSGNANVSDGERGLETAYAMQSAAAEALDIDASQVAVASTGVIGRELHRDRVVAGVRHACEGRGPNAQAFAEAIMTTDRWEKAACLAVTLPSGGTVKLAAQAKGGGMLQPHHATMLCFAQTDAALEPETCALLTRVCVKRSFDRITVDGQLSTSDTVVLMANGASGVTVEPESDDERAMGEALDALFRQLAVSMATDGEGAERVGRAVVSGDPNLVERVARAVGNSPLVKTALSGGDPNYGRILQAAGAALAGGGGAFELDLSIQGIELVRRGAVVDLSEAGWEDLEHAVLENEVDFDIGIPGEGGEAELFFSDLGHDYVTLNADYTT